MEQPSPTDAEITLHDLTDQVMGKLVCLGARLEEQPRLTAFLRLCEHLVLSTLEHGSDKSPRSRTAHHRRHPKELPRYRRERRYSLANALCRVPGHVGRYFAKRSNMEGTRTAHQ